MPLFKVKLHRVMIHRTQTSSVGEVAITAKDIGKAHKIVENMIGRSVDEDFVPYHDVGIEEGLPSAIAEEAKIESIAQVDEDEVDTVYTEDDIRRTRARK